MVLQESYAGYYYQNFGEQNVRNGVYEERGILEESRYQNQFIDQICQLCVIMRKIDDNYDEWKTSDIHVRYII